MTPKELLLKNLGYDDYSIFGIVKYQYIKRNDIISKFWYFPRKGYKGYEIIKMTSTNPKIFGLSEEVLNRRIDYLLEKGYNMEEVINLTVTFPSIFDYDESLVEKVFHHFLECGYSKEEVRRIIKVSPEICNYNKKYLDKIDYIIKNLFKMGYKSIDIEKTFSLMEKYYFAYHYIDDKYKYFMEEGYCDKLLNYVNLSSAISKIYSCNLEDLDDKINYMVKYGYVVDALKTVSNEISSSIYIHERNRKRERR